MRIRCCGKVFTKPLPRNECCFRVVGYQWLFLSPQFPPWANMPQSY
jgi:hypothetical protein